MRPRAAAARALPSSPPSTATPLPAASYRGSLRLQRRDENFLEAQRLGRHRLGRFRAQPLEHGGGVAPCDDLDLAAAPADDARVEIEVGGLAGEARVDL